MIATAPQPVVLRNSDLSIRTAIESLEISQLRAVLDEQHYLKAGRPAGHVLWQGAWKHDPESGIDRLVAVFCWARAAKRLKDRAEWQRVQGFRPLLAESFHDPAVHQGTLYKVTNWKKDATLWREDRGVRRKAKEARNLALLRNAVLALIRPEQHASLKHAFLHYATTARLPSGS